MPEKAATVIGEPLERYISSTRSGDGSPMQHILRFRRRWFLMMLCMETIPLQKRSHRLHSMCPSTPNSRSYLSTMPEAPKQPSLHPSSGHHHLSKNWRALDFIEQVTSNPDAVQARVLSEILSRNAQVEYLRRHRLDGRTDRHSKQLLPVISYEDIHHDVSGIMATPPPSSAPSPFPSSSLEEADADHRGGAGPEVFALQPSHAGDQPILRQPDPALAAFIEAECRRSWAGIITRLWPNTKYVGVIVTGTMSQYIPTLDYYSGGLPLVCTTNSSTARVNSPLTTELVDLADVKLGQEYELVVTTYAVISVLSSCNMRVLVLQVERIKAKKESGEEVQHPQETEDLRQALGDMTEDGVGVGEGFGHRDPHSSSSPSI
ncbi:hypothetical protein SAY87_031664 [Trapa incisa]|uniref:Uncharacterized protein n=1 Tax=Trapa incisa TaxID=236973 RepID=A0AAN7KQ52_9MYRT|nr:hypothetical protein SAY87_031664 [Trapa incisa]